MTPAEVERARAQMKAGLLMGLESPSSRAERNARMVTDLGPSARHRGDGGEDRRGHHR
jgi:predicted Zn-dependent peptidase